MNILLLSDLWITCTTVAHAGVIGSTPERMRGRLSSRSFIEGKSYKTRVADSENDASTSCHDVTCAQEFHQSGHFNENYQVSPKMSLSSWFETHSNSWQCMMAPHMLQARQCMVTMAINVDHTRCKGPRQSSQFSHILAQALAR